jgi:hypothetical protein
MSQVLNCGFMSPVKEEARVLSRYSNLWRPGRKRPRGLTDPQWIVGAEGEYRYPGREIMS